MAQMAPGARVSEYILLETVGSGSFGEVWKARHHIWEDQVVAVKVATDAQYVRNLQTEGVTIHGLRHRNIVRAMGLDPYASPPYLVMEFVDGPTLRELIDSNPSGLPVPTVCALLRGILEALKHAHENGVVHRDVKPANVLIASRDALDALRAEDVRVTDFGLGEAAGVTKSSILASGSLLTEEGKSISGTIAYMAPEQRDGGHVDHCADLYACGIVLFEMLTGQLPQGGDLPGHVRDDVPEWMDALFSRCYTRRDRRFGSAREILEELDNHAPDAEESGDAPPPPPKPRRSLPRAKLVLNKQGRRDDYCNQCGHRLDPEDNFCIKCGSQVNPNPPRCPECRAYVDPRAKYCVMCGASLETMGC